MKHVLHHPSTRSLARALLAIALLSPTRFTAAAQEPAPQASSAISGLAVDASTRAPLADVRITLLRAADSAAVAAATSGADGRFRLSGLRAGSYVVALSTIGYSPLGVRAEVAVGLQTVDLGAVSLAPSAVLLSEVVVTAEPPAVVYAPDRDIYAAAALPGAIGGTATEILGAIPEVEVDANGAITLRGQRPEVYINGRPAPMRGEALDAFLQQYAAENIETVEVMTNPSARYESEGAGGIVNIVLKRDARLGTNGSLSVNGGTRGDLGSTARVTRNTGALTLTGGASLRLNRTDSRSTLLRQNIVREPTTYLQEEADSDRESWSGSFDFTAEYQLSAKSTVSAESRLNQATGDTDRVTTYTEMDDAMGVTDEYVRNALNGTGGLSGDLALQLEHQFDRRAGHELSVEVESSLGGDQRESLIRRRLDELFGETDHLFELTTDDASENDAEIGVGVDYSRTIRGTQLELGYDGTFGRNADERVRRIGVDGAPEEAVEVRETGFLHTQAINSAYLTARRRIGNLTAQAGLRADHAAARYERSASDVFESDYLSFFPSANLSYPLGTGRRLRLSYSLRTRRPSANVLDPTDRSTDPMNRQVGNPDIDPQLTHSVSLDASWTSGLGTLRLAPFYTRTVDEWAQLKTVAEGGVSTTTWANLASTVAYGSTLSLSVRDLLGMNGSINLNGQLEDRDWAAVTSRAARTTTRWSVRTNLSGALTSTSTLSGSLSYTPPRDQAQGRASGLISTSLSARQRMLDGRGSLGLSLSDPLGLSARSTVSTQGRGFIETGGDRVSSRRATLSFSYTFGGGGARRRTTAAAPTSGAAVAAPGGSAQAGTGGAADGGQRR